MLTQVCPCGHVLKIKEEQVGKRGRCPACSTVLRLGPESPVDARKTHRPEPEAEEEDAPEEGEQEGKRRKRKKKRKKGGGWFSFMPAIAVDIRFLGISVSTWIKTALVLLFLGATVWAITPGFGPRSYYSIEPFGQAPPHDFVGTTSKGITVSIHNTGVGQIDVKLTTIRWAGSLKGAVRTEREQKITVKGTQTKGDRSVAYEVEWSADKGVVSVTCDGSGVSRAIWEFDSGQEHF